MTLQLELLLNRHSHDESSRSRSWIRTIIFLYESGNIFSWITFNPHNQKYVGNVGLWVSRRPWTAFIFFLFMSEWLTASPCTWSRMRERRPWPLNLIQDERQKLIIRVEWHILPVTQAASYVKVSREMFTCLSYYFVCLSSKRVPFWWDYDEIPQNLILLPLFETFLWKSRYVIL